MIHVVTARNRRIYAQQIAEMHQLRRVHFIEERGWDGLTVREDGGEYDMFDDERTIYFFSLNKDGQIEVSVRARPTDDKCMLADLFPQLIAPDETPKKGAAVWEISRIFSTVDFRRQRRRMAINRIAEVFLASMETAHAAGAQRLVGILDVYLYSAASNLGWNMRMTGLPVPYKEGVAAGIEVSATAADVAQFQERLGRRRPIAYEATAADVERYGSIVAMQQAINEQWQEADRRLERAEQARELLAASGDRALHLPDATEASHVQAGNLKEGLADLSPDNREIFVQIMRRVGEIEEAQGSVAAETAIRKVSRLLVDV